jgi:hypothetical protein
MVGFPHPYVITTVAADRLAALRAEATRERLGRLAQPNSDRRPRLADLITMPAVGVVLALLLAASHGV